MKIDWTHPTQAISVYDRRKRIQRTVELLAALEVEGLPREMFFGYWSRPEEDEAGRRIIQPPTDRYLQHIFMALHIGSGCVQELRENCATDEEDDRMAKKWARRQMWICRRMMVEWFFERAMNRFKRAFIGVAKKGETK